MGIRGLEFGHGALLPGFARRGPRAREGIAAADRGVRRSVAAQAARRPAGAPYGNLTEREVLLFQ
ncbi:hypothetical protein GLE_1559 [Lysobacter enzymogenes]|uniref:Uncharacterized protein n=1 Tax=Lysobacter enzymogenes TaxID=69 RepID=A0A0S2DED2_LYSEN|nr:hypothetical protein GLE_1559 [Lysobacter enzymogenes]